MPPKAAATTIEELENLVRQGHFSQARKMLAKTNLKKIPREQALGYANLARRLDLGALSLKILNPIVRAGQSRNSRPVAAATADEKIEYAASLRNLGAVAEAWDILQEIDARSHPPATFHLALCLIAQWRYRATIPLLETYIASFKKPSYAMLVGKINLLQALIHEEKMHEARVLSNDLQLAIDRKEHSLLHQKHLELAAQLEIVSGNWQEALNHLEEARSLLTGQEDSSNTVYLAKWKAVARSLSVGSVLPDLLEVRAQSLHFGQWEAVRDCDFYVAKISSDKSALIRLYFSTPHESYRAKIDRLLGSPSALPSRLVWLTTEESSPRQVFDLALGQTPQRDIQLSPGQELHRLLIAVCQDLYKPTPLLSLFSKLFPGELFNPDNSPNRVHQIIKRFRKWSQGHALRMQLEEVSGSYRIQLSGRFAIAIPRDPLPLTQKELELHKLRDLLAETATSFTTSDAIRALGTSRAAVQRLLSWAITHKRLVLEGKTNRACYRWQARDVQ